MAISRVKNWGAEILYASDLNAEFNNILNNATSLVSPFTAAVDFDGNTITLDAAAVTTMNSTTAISLNVTSGAKAGTPSTTGSLANFSTQTYNDSGTTASNTASSHAFFALQRPGMTATNAGVW